MSARTSVDSPGPAMWATRPVAVMVVTVLAVAAAGYAFVTGAIDLSDAGDDRAKIVDGVLEIALGLVALAIAFGALQMRPWAWKLFMVVAVVGLTHQLLRHFWFGDPRYARMALNVVIVLALTPRDVQVAFGIRPPPNAELTRTTRNSLDRA